MYDVLYTYYSSPCTYERFRLPTKTAGLSTQSGEITTYCTRGSVSAFTLHAIAYYLVYSVYWLTVIPTVARWNTYCRHI